MTRQRITVSLDADVVAYARRLVRDGRAESVSAWVNEAMRRHLEYEGRLQAGHEWIAWHESEYGVITEEKMEEADRYFAERAIHVEGKGKPIPRSGAA